MLPADALVIATRQDVLLGNVFACKSKPVSQGKIQIRRVYTFNVCLSLTPRMWKMC